MTDSARVEIEVGAAAKSAAPTAQRSVLDRMKDELATRKSAKAAIVELRHDACPEVTLFCRVPDDGEKVSEIMEIASKRARGKSTGTVWFNRLIVAHYTQAIEWHGERLMTDTGIDLTFASKQLQESLNASDAPSAVFELLGSDAHVGVLAAKLMEKGGFGNDAAVEVVEDPTTGR